MSAKTPTVELSIATKAASYTVLVCPKCLPKLKVASSWKQHNIYNWAIMLSCGECSTSWMVCHQCPLVHTHFILLRQVRCHNNRCHALPVVTQHHSDDGTTPTKEREHLMHPSYANSPTFDDPINLEFPDEDESFIAPVKVEMPPSEFETYVKGSLQMQPPSFNYSSPESSKYHEHEHAGDGSGNCYLVGRSQFRSSVTQAAELDVEEVDYHILLTKLVSSISHGDRMMLSQILSDTVQIVKKQMLWDHSSGHKLTSIPTTASCIRCRYVEGKYSIIRNLPYPPVQVVDGHAYVSLRDCVADILANGVELDFIEPSTNMTSSPTQILLSPVRKISESVHAKLIADRASIVHGNRKVLVLYFNEWSDDFEPMYSSKGNRSSAWLKTITISPPYGNIHSLSHTYPVSLGKKSSSHEAVQHMFAKEMRDLSSGVNNWFYSKLVKANIQVHVEMFVSLQDQPERRSANYVMLGGSRFTARWGHAIDFAAVASGVPSCRDCLLKMTCPGSSLVIDSDGSGQCHKCSNWDVNVDCGLLDFPPPKNYPESEVLQPSGLLRPLKLSYDVMKEAVVKTHNKIVADEWAVENGKAYLWVHGINTEAIAEVLENASNVKMFNALEEQRLLYPEDYDVLCHSKQKNPNAFHMWTFPALWECGVLLQQHVEVVIHILFLGIINASDGCTQERLKERGKNELFLQCKDGAPKCSGSEA